MEICFSRFIFSKNNIDQYFENTRNKSILNEIFVNKISFFLVYFPFAQQERVILIYLYREVFYYYSLHNFYFRLSEIFLMLYLFLAKLLCSHYFELPAKDLLELRNAFLMKERWHMEQGIFLNLCLNAEQNL